MENDGNEISAPLFILAVTFSAIVPIALYVNNQITAIVAGLIAGLLIVFCLRLFPRSDGTINWGVVGKSAFLFTTVIILSITLKGHI